MMTFKSLDAALNRAQETGQIKHLRRMSDEAWTCKPLLAWDTIARALSCALGGMVHTRRDGLTWQYSNSLTGYVSDHKSWKHILEARACLDALGIASAYSVPACARRIVEWVGVPESYESGCTALLDGIKLGYHDCEPGKYHNAALWDVSSCYYQLLYRLPSLRLSVAGNDLQFSKTEPSEWSRWRDALAAVKDAKSLRNCMWGAALGKVERKKLRAWSHGEPRYIQLPRGPFHAVALLVGRTAWELNRDASEETGAIYSQTDCVITTGAKPKTWEARGLPTRVKHEGESEVCMRGIYHVDFTDPKGATEWYRRGARMYDATPCELPPSVAYNAMWL